MTETTTNDALSSVIAPVLVPLGLHLYDVELAGASGRARTLRVLVERADGEPVDLDVITSATEVLSPVLDSDPGADRILRGAYTLEVSSPGLERPLRTPAQFQGAHGETVSLKLGARQDVRRVRGVVVGADDHAVELEVDGERESFAYTDVTQARTVFEWGTPTKTKTKTQRVS
jgi:ribosome maturation factor RimP